MSFIIVKILILLALFFWFMAVLVFFYKKNSKSIFSEIFTIFGVLSLLGLTIYLWIILERPPMRTLGETRLLYSLFLPVIGLVAFKRWKYFWLLSYSLVVASVFLIINLFNPENFDKTLMPALQSPWFIPHVIVYIFSYALLAAAAIISVKVLFYYNKKEALINIEIADNIVYLGIAFLTLGLLFGALWAKEAWGHYWTWDPKETWAFLTWISYLIYIHLRFYQPKKVKQSFWVLIIAFVVLLICWFGMNYLPAAQQSIHVYTS